MVFRGIGRPHRLRLGYRPEVVDANRYIGETACADLIGAPAHVWVRMSFTATASPSISLSCRSSNRSSKRVALTRWTRYRANHSTPRGMRFKLFRKALRICTWSSLGVHVGRTFLLAIVFLLTTTACARHCSFTEYWA